MHAIGESSAGEATGDDCESTAQAEYERHGVCWRRPLEPERTEQKLRSAGADRENSEQESNATESGMKHLRQVAPCIGHARAD